MGVVAVNVVGEEVISGGDSINVEGKSDILMAATSLMALGGGISDASSFRFLPFGAGSNGGDRLYVTVLVTTDRTLTGFEHALLGASKNRRVALSQFQSAGENGE